MNHRPDDYPGPPNEGDFEPSQPGFVIPQAVPDVNLEDIALPQDFSLFGAVNTQDPAPRVGKPSKQAFFSPHPDQLLWQRVAVVEDESDGKAPYVLTREMTTRVPEGDWTAKILVPCITRNGTIFLWSIRCPDPDGKIDSWNQSALSIALSMGNSWLRIAANREAQGYRMCEPVTSFPPPEWPGNMKEIIQKALKSIVIDKLDHPLLKRLRGEA